MLLSLISHIMHWDKFLLYDVKRTTELSFHGICCYTWHHSDVIHILVLSRFSHIFSLVLDKLLSLILGYSKELFLLYDVKLQDYLFHAFFAILGIAAGHTCMIMYYLSFPWDGGSGYLPEPTLLADLTSTEIWCT